MSKFKIVVQHLRKDSIEFSSATFYVSSHSLLIWRQNVSIMNLSSKYLKRSAEQVSSRYRFECDPENRTFLLRVFSPSVQMNVKIEPLNRLWSIPLQFFLFTKS